ncbi:MAG: gamma-glutamyl-phosphate reductase, partial [Deltaproteobacteria bacterium]|nr:gamma-glutamyl-phosphate reductase [Deltaproteobacteria bacterium]
MEEIIQLARQAREASWEAAKLTTEQKNQVLLKAAERLLDQQARIAAENAKDLEAAEAKGLSAAMVDRLRLNRARIEEMARGLQEVVQLPDPVGQVTKEWTRPNGLKVQKVRIP